MKYFSENSDYINAECEHCNRILKIKKEKLTLSENGFLSTNPSGLKCICGTIHHNIIGNKRQKKMNINHQIENSNKKEISNFGIGLTTLSIIVFIFVMSHSCTSSSSSSYSSNTNKDKWYKGGTLHSCTVGEWKRATSKNKLATSGDWLASTVWKGHLNSSGDFVRLKAKAQSLVYGINNSVYGVDMDSMAISEIVLLIIKTSPELGP